MNTQSINQKLIQRTITGNSTNLDGSHYKQQSRRNFSDNSFDNDLSIIKKLNQRPNETNLNKIKISKRYNTLTASQQKRINRLKSSKSFSNQLYIPHAKLFRIQDSIQGREYKSNDGSSNEISQANKQMRNRHKSLKLHTKLTQPNEETKKQQVGFSFLTQLNYQKRNRIMEIYRPKKSIDSKKHKTSKQNYQQKKRLNLTQQQQIKTNIQNKKSQQNQLRLVNRFNSKTIDSVTDIVFHKDYSQTKSQKRIQHKKIKLNSKLNYELKSYDKSQLQNKHEVNNSVNSQKNNKKLVINTLKLEQTSKQLSKRQKSKLQQKIIHESELSISQIKFSNKNIQTIQLISNDKNNKKLNVNAKSCQNTNLQRYTTKQNDKKHILKYIDFYDNFMSEQMITKTKNNRIKKVKQTRLTPSVIEQPLNHPKVCEQNQQLLQSYSRLSPQFDIKVKGKLLQQRNYSSRLNIFNQILSNQRFDIKRFKNGIMFAQKFINDLIHGQGIIFYNNGKIFQGSFQNGKKTAQGYQLYPDGSFFLGNYSHDQKNGKGRFQWQNGQIYDGQWHNDTKHGSGQWIAQNITYMGQWNNNKIQGFGVLIQGNQRYEGQLINFSKHGHGSYRYQNGQLYIGELRNNRLMGEGEYHWPNGDYYKGNFLNSKRNGHGLLQIKKQKIQYQGEFKNDKKCGFGQETFNNEITYIGNFQNDLRHGWGCLKKNSDIIYQGYWINNSAVQISETPVPNLTIKQEDQQYLKIEKTRQVLNKNKRNEKISIEKVPFNKKPGFEVKSYKVQQNIIKGRSRYMRMNNHFIKKSIIDEKNINTKRLDKSRSLSHKRQYIN